MWYDLGDGAKRQNSRDEREIEKLEASGTRLQDAVD